MRKAQRPKEPSLWLVQLRGAAFARHLTKAASMENYKAPDITPGAYSLSMISCYLRK